MGIRFFRIDELLQNLEVRQEGKYDTCGEVKRNNASYKAEQSCKNAAEDAANESEGESYAPTDQNLKDDRNDELRNLSTLLEGEGPDFFEKIHDKSPFYVFLCFSDEKHGYFASEYRCYTYIIAFCGRNVNRFFEIKCTIL